jgi:hypothetical protein
MKMSRREFVKSVPAGAMSAGFVTPAIAWTSSQDIPAIHPAFPAQDPAKVRETVGASHGKLDRVKELVGAQPALARATWDWGFGDWETALGAASHVGNREIAEFLVLNGARPDLFFHAMMGHLDAVKAAVAAQPGIQRIHGPHGITLLSHAKAGGDEAAEVLKYLESLGDADQRALSQPIFDAEKEVYIGRYVFGKGKDDVLTVDKSSQGLLWIRRTEQFGRTLNRVEEHAFAPTGTSKVVIRFKVEGGKATSLTIHDPGPVLTAVR